MVASMPSSDASFYSEDSFLVTDDAGAPDLKRGRREADAFFKVLPSNGQTCLVDTMTDGRLCAGAGSAGGVTLGSLHKLADMKVRIPLLASSSGQRKEGKMTRK
jgi:hypothetical protein